MPSLLALSEFLSFFQTYLSEYEDDGADGHISLGRSFALEMASLIPLSDQRLGKLTPLPSTYCKA
jgi:phosphatidylinositol 4-kinase A